MCHPPLSGACAMFNEHLPDIAMLKHAKRPNRRTDQVYLLQSEVSTRECQTWPFL